MIVLLTFYAISKHPQGNAYDIREHNRFFFSWTILMVATQHHPDINTATETLLMEHPNSKDHPLVLAKLVVATAEKIFPDLILKDPATLEEQQQENSKERNTISEGTPFYARILQEIPEGVLESPSKRILDAKLPLGLRETLDNQVRKVVDEEGAKPYRRILERINIPVKSRVCVWIEGDHSS
ncbi:hypothetical protein PQX77_003499 [Marasmius sp. AFHP31]|nr:hypothetical protein PQX77_003499 [Marasmius sp. AFHP31]